MEQLKNRSPEQLSRAILLTANKLFDEHGVEATSMHQIAKGAGIGQGTLYRRYANKGDLCMALMQDNFMQLCSELEAALEEAANLPVKERLYITFRNVISFIDKKSELLFVMHSYIKVEDPKLNFCQSPPYSFLYKTIHRLLAEAKDSGMAASVDPVLASHSLIAAVSPFMYLHLKLVCGYTEQQVLDSFFSTFLEPMLRHSGKGA